MSYFWDRLSLRSLISVSMLGSMALGGLVLMIVAYFWESRQLAFKEEKELKNSLSLIQGQLLASAEQGSWLNSKKMFAAYSTDAGVRKLLLTLSDGTVVLANRREWEGRTLASFAESPLVALQKLPAPPVGAFVFEHFYSENIIYARSTLNMPLHHKGIRSSQNVDLLLSYDTTQKHREMLIQLAEFLWTLTLISLGVIFWVYMLLNQRLIEPLKRLSQFSRLLDSGHYGSQMNEQVGKEFTILSQVLNLLSRNLKSKIEKEQEQSAQLQNMVEHLKQQQGELRVAACAFESSDGIIVTDHNRKILRVNSAFTDITGYDIEDVLGKTPRILSSGRHDDAFYEAMWRDINKLGSWKGEIWNKKKNGEIYPQLLSVTAVHSRQGEVTNYVGSLTDLTELKRSEQEINRLSFYDKLTGLPNRQYFLESLTKHLAVDAKAIQASGVIYIGLDHFKDINEALGHHLGDELLCQVAVRLSSMLDTEEVLARFGGDEFALLVKGLGYSEEGTLFKVQNIAERMMNALSRVFVIDGQRIHVSASFGISLAPYDGEDPDSLVRKANTAMDNAKSSGGHSIHIYSDEMYEQVDTRFKIRHLLGDAIKHDLLEMYLQPQLDVSTGEIAGAECLIRWNHPQQGFVPPDLFIPVAESCNLIIELDAWVLRKACAYLAELDAQGIRLPILSVNISAKHFLQADFEEKVKGIITSSKADPRRICIEITEGAFIGNIEEAARRISNLRHFGIDVSVDDFGTGYSSLSYLEKLPLDELKIDKSFMDKVPDDHFGMAITESVIEMAKKLNYRVVAEGVETEAQLSFLKKHGCTVYQGYYFSRPLPMAEFVDLANRSNVQTLQR